MKEIYLITNNVGKILSAQKAFIDSDIKLKQLKGDFFEIRADSSLEIAKFTALKVAKEKNVCVIREDHSLFINELGFPGPYTKYIEERLPPEKLISLIKKDFTGYFEVATVYAEPNGLTKEFVFKVPIKLSKELKGSRGKWNKVLMLKNSDKTFAESTEDENINIWNENFKKIANYLKGRFKKNN
ncbi:MAG: non-canonical purine NTP pyrophosphatase [Candidatus Nanoarchaeia archaeon]|nr:non-canonical purine NTP pyrophosphatase [Candidatus Nanoarchaeia archaeon]